MTAQILSSHQLANQLHSEITEQVQELFQQFQVKPCLLVILIGHNPASQIYVNHKKNACAKVGIDCVIETYPESFTEEELKSVLKHHNEHPRINGILIQFPLPKHINPFNIIEHIDPKKDVDGFHPYNLGRLAAGNPFLRPCTPYGIIQLLNHYQIPLQSTEALVIGVSRIVGRPMALELLLPKATVTMAHSQTKDLQKKINENQLIIVATGKKGVISEKQLKPHHIIVDVGIHRLENNKICGDIDFEVASKIVSAITPVPGGVGPMTICTLLQNIVQAYKNQYLHKP